MGEPTQVDESNTGIPSADTSGQRPDLFPYSSLAQGEDLKYLNQSWGYSNDSVSGIRKENIGFLGRLRIRIGGMIAGRFLAPYLNAEREFLEHLVKLLNEVCRRMDIRERRAVDLAEASFRSIEKRLGDMFGSMQAGIDSRFDEAAAKTTNCGNRLTTLESVASGLERIVAQLEPPPGGDAEGSTAMPQTHHERPAGLGYLLLENRFRGSAEEISARLSIYPDYFRGSTLPVVEIGAGRGELQQLFRAQSIAAYGIELNSSMAEECRARGLDVRTDDGLKHLAALADRSLGGVIAVQVIEHLDLPVLKQLFELCAKKIAIGGKVIFETINTKSLVACAHNYYRDPTHTAPMHPDTMKFFVEAAGFRVTEVRNLAPYPPAAWVDPGRLGSVSRGQPAYAGQYRGA